jgi:hypothetical protein
MRTIIAAALTCLLGVAGAAALADPSAEPPADVTSKIDMGSAAVSAATGPEGTTLDFARTSYQGTATVSFKSSTPAWLRLRFPAVRNMQTLTVSDGKRSFSCATAWSGGRTVVWFDKAGRTVTSSTMAAVTMVLEANKAGDLEVTLTSARGMEPGAELKVSWMQLLRIRRGDWRVPLAEFNP